LGSNKNSNGLRSEPGGLLVFMRGRGQEWLCLEGVPYSRKQAVGGRDTKIPEVRNSLER